MSITKTLGGDRLGSGKKMKVEMHGFERSTHDLSYIWRSTMSPGTLVPYLCEVALPGDTWDISLNAEGLTHPTKGPLFGRFKMQLDVFQIPMRLYHAKLHNNALGIGMNMADIKLPQIQVLAKDGIKEDIDNQQVNPSSIFAYLGIRGFLITGDNAGTEREFNAIPLLAYWEIYKNYYANKQEEKGAVIHRQPFYKNINKLEYIISGVSSTIDQYPTQSASPFVGTNDQINIDVLSGTQSLGNIKVLTNINNGSNGGWMPLLDLIATNDTEITVSTAYQIKRSPRFIIYAWDYMSAGELPIKPRVELFPLSNIDDMRQNILTYNLPHTPFIAATWNPILAPAYNIVPYEYTVTEDSTNEQFILSSQEGLAVKTYQSDLFNNWLQTSWVNDINLASAVSTVSGSFTMDQLNLSQKVYALLNRIAVSGGSYDDWLDAVWAGNRVKRAESPMYVGGLIKEMAFDEVVSNTGTEDNPLGTLAGRGKMTSKHKGGKVVIHVEEPSYIMGIISLTPLLDYSQGNKWDVNLKTIDDLHKPDLDQIGFQDLITEKMAWWSTYWDGSKIVQQSAGKQPAWIDYMTNVNQVRGNFAIDGNEMFMTLNRRYEAASINPLSPVPQKIKDLTTYIDPEKYNQIFAMTSLDAQNFWVQIGLDIEARRKMSAKVMPNL